jgi:hypothetical protein
MLGAQCRVSLVLKFYILRMAIYVRELAMDTFWTIVIILVILWAVGFFALPGVGALIHLLLVIAVIVIVYRLLTGRHILTGDKR